MSNLSQNYHARKCYISRKQVPTQSVIRKTMSPVLADVYFKSMTPKLKVMAGLEPSLKGGGNNWCMSPEDVLQGRSVLKPINANHLVILSFYAIDEIGMQIVKTHRVQMREARKRLIYDNEILWRNELAEVTRKEEERCGIEAAEATTAYITKMYNSFAILYTRSISTFQNLLFDASINKIKTYQETTFKKMQTHYEHLVKQQAAMLHSRYTKKLDKIKGKLKEKFIEALEIRRTEFGKKLHDVNVEKHVAVEKLRHYLECQTLACQVYVAMREREECNKKMDLAKLKHSKQVKKLKVELFYQAFEIYQAVIKEKKKMEISMIWKKKVCYVVKTFQTFVLYCLKMLPEHADFFLNMEKLLLLQLSEALDKPTVDSIIEHEAAYTDPVPKPRPFYLFCNRGSHTTVDTNLCPKHVTSSASQIPVIVINKRCIYAACDNFKQFTDTIKDYVHGALNNDIEDDYDYTRHLNVTYTSSEQLRELKLQSSLMQVLQQEIANLRNDTIKCDRCNMPQCFCFDDDLPVRAGPGKVVVATKKSESPTMEYKSPLRLVKLKHERAPKLDSYMKYIKPKKCECAKLCKGHLLEHLPSYTTKMSKFDAPVFFNYEKCSVNTFKRLVKKAQPRKDTIKPQKVEPRTTELGIQCADIEFDYLCNCVSDMSFAHFIDNLRSDKKLKNEERQFRFIEGARSESKLSYLTKEPATFAIDRAISLRRLVDQAPDVIEIFKTKECVFDFE